MELSTGLRADLDEIGRTLDPPEQHLAGAVTSLAHDAGLAVPSLLGLSVTLVIHSQPVELVSMPDGAGPDDVRSSLQMTLPDLVSDGVHGVVTFYAGVRDAFLDLAADLATTLPAQTSDLRVDTALTPCLVSGVTGFRELTTINRAMGILISEGYDGEDATNLLLREATSTRTGLLETARRILAAKRSHSPPLS